MEWSWNRTVAQVFPDSESVNQALRALAGIIQYQSEKSTSVTLSDTRISEYGEEMKPQSVPALR